MRVLCLYLRLFFLQRHSNTTTDFNVFCSKAMALEHNMWESVSFRGRIDSSRGLTPIFEH